MADDKTKTGGQDRLRINLNEYYEVQDWSKKFNVSENELRDAVKKVGNKAADVEEYLNSGRKN
jgi:hypothetical protein